MAARVGSPLPEWIGSVLLRFTGHMWWNAMHGVVLGGLFLALVVVSLALVLQLRSRDLTPLGGESSLRWTRRACAAMVAVGWAAVISGTFVVDHWFHAHTPASPAALLVQPTANVSWGAAALRVKELLSWASAILASGAAYVVYRRGSSLLGAASARRPATLLLAGAIGLGAAGGALGVVLTKLVPIL